MKTLEVLEKVLKGKRVKEGTKRHYIEALRSLAKFSEDWPSDGSVINEWLASLSNFSDTTVKMWFNFMNSAGKYIKKIYKIDNPCEDAERPKVSKKRRRYFNAKELVDILRACSKDSDFEKALVMTLIDSTCRIGELVKLKGGDVGEGSITVTGKTGERKYRLDNGICEKLKELAGGDDKPVFKAKSGGFYRSDSLAKRVRYLIWKAGIKGSKVGPHTLRHSSASLVAEATGSALAVKAVLQHDNIETSMGYIHDVEDDIKQRISPLRLVLVREKIIGQDDLVEFEAKQIPQVASDDAFGEAVDMVEGVAVDVDDMLGEQFAEISDGVAVRPLLKTEDLRLMRRLFMVAIRSGDVSSDETEAIGLMKRMLRFVKSKA